MRARVRRRNSARAASFDGAEFPCANRAQILLRNADSRVKIASFLLFRMRRECLPTLHDSTAMHAQIPQNCLAVLLPGDVASSARATTADLPERSRGSRPSDDPRRRRERDGDAFARRDCRGIVLACVVSHG